MNNEHNLLRVITMIKNDVSDVTCQLGNTHFLTFNYSKLLAMVMGIKGEWE